MKLKYMQSQSFTNHLNFGGVSPDFIALI